MSYRVELTYFKPLTGKHYASGEYESNEELLFKIWDEVRAKRIAGVLPGLVEGSREWIILIDVPQHPHAHPKLLPYYATELFDERYPLKED